MSIPDVTVGISDGQLGVLPESVDGLSVKIGVCSLGVVDQIYAFTKKADMIAQLGVGPLVESAAYHLDVSGQPLICVPVNPSVAGTNGSVTKNGSSTATLVVTGTPKDTYDVILDIIKGGATIAAVTASFKFSMDGGDSFSPEIAIPSSGVYVIPNTGLTLTWSYVSGVAFIAGDSYVFQSVAPGFALSDLQAAIDALLADPREWGFIHVVGESTESITAGVAARMATAEAQYRFAFALMEATIQGATSDATWQSTLIAAYATFSSSRIMVAAGEEELISPITGRISSRSAAWVVAARLAKAPISEDLGRVKSGSLPGVDSLHHNEQVNPGLDSKKFATLRTIIGRSGFYITAGKMMAADGSDFALVQRRRIMDRGCKIARDGLLNYLNEKIAVDAVTGKINEVAARGIERFVKGLVDADLKSAGHISDSSFVVDRDANLLSTETLLGTLSIVPVGYARAISLTIGFVNPALVVQAA